jgi:hypothetical protein
MKYAVVEASVEETMLHQKESDQQDSNVNPGQQNILINFLLGNGVFCPVRDEAHRRKNFKDGFMSVGFIPNVVGKAESLSTEPLLKYTQRELDEMISVAVEESKKASEGLLTENTRLELEELTRMYEDTRNQYMDEIHRMQAQMQSLDISNVISEAVQEATRAANESLEIYEEQRYQSAEKMNSIRKHMEQIIQEYDINQNDTSEIPPGQEDADHSIKLLLKRLAEILAHQREKNVENDKLITFLSTKLVDAEAVIINLEENNCMLEQKVGSTATDAAIPSATKKRVTFKVGAPEEFGEEENASLKPEPAQLWFWR